MREMTYNEKIKLYFWEKAVEETKAEMEAEEAQKAQATEEATKKTEDN